MLAATSISPTIAQQALEILLQVLGAGLLSVLTWLATVELPKLLSQQGWQKWVGLALQSANGLSLAMAPQALKAAEDALAQGKTPAEAGKAALDVLSAALTAKLGPDFKKTLLKQLGDATDAFFLKLFSGALAGNVHQAFPVGGAGNPVYTPAAKLLQHLNAIG